MTWTQTATFLPYIQRSETRLYHANGVDNALSVSEQTLDDYGSHAGTAERTGASRFVEVYGYTPAGQVA